MTFQTMPVNKKFDGRFRGKFTGVRKTARALGLSAGHVTQVWQGKRQSARVLALRPKEFSK